MLNLFNMTPQTVVGIIGDNCTTNRSFSRMFDCGFVGCVSHRFNLAVRDLIESHKESAKSVQDLMNKLRHPSGRAKLRTHTPLETIVSNARRWSSSHSMLQRYIKFREFFPLLEMKEIDDLLLSRKQDQEIERLSGTMVQIDSVTLHIQREDTTLTECRALFSTVRAVSSVIFEGQVFLHVNRTFWAISDVNAIIELAENCVPSHSK